MADVKRLGETDGEAAPRLDDEAANDRGLTRGERSVVQRVSEALKVADLLGFLMVAATLMSAFATWRMASITGMLFVVAERPYVGIQEISLDPVRANMARLRVDFRNFGHVSATDGVARVWILIDGKELKHQRGGATTINVGMVSPSVPHLSYRFVPQNVYDAVMDGRAKMVVQCEIIYRGPDQREFCYHELLTYDDQAGAFVSTGGNDHCGSAIY
jgi:hypothetical protein